VGHDLSVKQVLGKVMFSQPANTHKTLSSQILENIFVGGDSDLDASEKAKKLENIAISGNLKGNLDLMQISTFSIQH
jgi:hypothetical protein